MNWFYKSLILIGLINPFFANSSLPIKHQECGHEEVKHVIQQTLWEMNQTIDPSIHLELLKNCTEVIPTLADWIYEDWSLYDPSLTREKLIEGFKNRLNDHDLPFTLVAFKNSIPVGLVTLKAHEVPELADLENGNPWGGSLHVVPKERGQGIGEALARSILLIAQRLGYTEVLFYLSEQQGVNWCVDRGAEILETRPFRGHTITVLRFKLTDC